MEMRLLTTEQEIQVFSNSVARARSQCGCSYRSVSRGCVDNEARLRAATLIGLFEHAEDPPEEMLAGMSIHDLQTFPQSCPEPDLSGFLPGSTFECGDHWSLTRGAGMQIWRAAAIYVARRKPAAVLAYLAVKPAAHGGFYAAMGFRPLGRIQPYVYLETPEGNPLVQGMVLDGEALQRLVEAASRLRVDSCRGSDITRFSNSGRLRQAVATEREKCLPSEIILRAA